MGDDAQDDALEDNLELVRRGVDGVGGNGGGEDGFCSNTFFLRPAAPFLIVINKN